MSGGAKDRIDTVAVVGAGALGAALCRALASKGCRVRLWNRTATHVAADLAADERIEIHAERAPLLAATPVADALVVAVSDRAIAAVARELAHAWPRGGGGPGAPAVALHTSGCTPPAALAALAERGAACGFVHPLAAITAGAHDLGDVPFGIGGEPAATDVARALVERMGGRALAVRPGAQARYHAAAALAAGGTIALAEAARALAADAFDDADDALVAVRRLVASAATNLGDATPREALTGPFVRGDAATIAAHLEVLEGHAGDPDGSDAAARRAGALLAALLPGLESLADARGTAPLDPDLRERIRRLARDA